MISFDPFRLTEKLRTENMDKPICKVKKNNYFQQFWCQLRGVKYSLLLCMTGVLFLSFLGCSTDKKAPKVSGSDNIISKGIPTDSMANYAAKQIGDNWCWAACIQMVLSVKGIKCDQTSVVKRTFGEIVDRPGRNDQIVKNLSGWFDVPSGQILLNPTLKKGPPEPEILYSYLDSGTPVILAIPNPGLNVGHAVVATGAVFKIHESKIIELLEVVVRDPSPHLSSTKGKRLLTFDEYSRASAHVVVDVVERR